jgi:hypothetical protein
MKKEGSRLGREPKEIADQFSTPTNICIASASSSPECILIPKFFAPERRNRSGDIRAADRASIVSHDDLVACVSPSDGSGA